MKYRLSKGEPIQGRLTDLTVTHNSLVDNPANGHKFLVIKGIEKEKMLTEIQKKQLENAGLSSEEISKADGEDGFLSKVKKFLGLNDVEKAVDPMTAMDTRIKAIETKVNDFISSDKKEDKTEDDKEAKDDKTTKKNFETSSDLSDIEKENVELEKQLKQEQDFIQKNQDLVKKNAELKKALEVVKNTRFGGNSIDNANQPNQNVNLTPEQIKKNQTVQIYKGSALGL